VNFQPVAENLRRVEIILNHGLPDDLRDEAVELQSRLVTLAREVDELRRSGRYTEQGIAETIQSRRGETLKWLGRFEARAKTQRDDLESTREKVAAGRLVRGADGRWNEPARRTLDVAAAVRASEIRQHARSLGETARRDLALRAFTAGDQETFDALESAPASLPLLDDSTRRIVRETRLRDFEPEFTRGMETVSVRERLSAAARVVLGIQD